MPYAHLKPKAGSSMDKIVSATVVLADEDDFASMNEVQLYARPLGPDTVTFNR